MGVGLVFVIGPGFWCKVFMDWVIIIDQVLICKVLDSNIIRTNMLFLQTLGTKSVNLRNLFQGLYLTFFDL